jgi:ABC-type transport system substrate-binding protein
LYHSDLEGSFSIVQGLIKSSRSKCFLLSLLAFSFIAGCNTTGNKGGGGSSGSATSAGNVLRYPLTTEPTSLDPARVEDGTTIDLIQQVFEGLVMWNERNEIAPNLAEKWELSSDGKTYTFHLKKGIKFHNGREVTAEDFKYSLTRACDPKMKSQTVQSYLKDIVGAMDVNAGKATEISGIKVVDPYTLQITLDGIKPYWLGNMTYPCAYVVCKEEVAKGGGEINENALASTTGTGPFKFAEVQRNNLVRLEAFAIYHGGRPKLDGILRPIVKDAGQRLNKYQVGELDIVEISPADLDRVQSDPTLQGDLKSFPRAATWYLGLNQDAADSPYTKREVRQAFAMAINKEEIIKVAMKGQADIANNIIPPGIKGRNESIKALPFDPAKARQLLAQAGYPDGNGFPPLTLSYRNDLPQVKSTAEVVAQQLKTNLGIQVQQRPMEWGQFLTEGKAKTIAFTHQRWAADYLDPQNFLSTLLHTSRQVNGQWDHPSNGVGYKNPEFDKLCDAADTERDESKRWELYAKAEQMAIEDAPWVPIYFQRDLELIKPRVKNLKDSLFGHRPHVSTEVTP